VRQVARAAARERVVEAALALQRGRRALKALRGEARRPHAAARALRLGEVRIARAHALAFDEAAGEARRQRDGVADAARVEPEQLRRRRRAAENAVDRARAEPVR